METKRHQNLAGKPTSADPFSIPAAEFPDKDQVIKKMMQIQEAMLSQLESAGSPNYNANLRQYGR